MASGKTHDQSIIISSFALLPVLVNYSPLDNSQIAMFTGMYLFSGLYLSPDIDMSKSVVSKRYGILKFIWYPYQKCFPHKGDFFNRNYFTHFPVLATLIRLVYFLTIPLIILNYYNIQINLEWLIMLYISCELASFLHLLLDILYTKTKKIKP